jgi:Ran GTPase-activating protein 1
MESLGKCTKLVSLDLQDNTLTELGSEALASAVASWPHLKSLNVGECLLRPSGSKTLFKALTQGHLLLEKLYLSFNEIDTVASGLLPTLIANKTHLTHLEQNGNEYDPEGSGVKALVDTLRAHGHPDALDELDEMEWGDESDQESDEDEEEGDSTAAQVDDNDNEEDVDALTRAVAQVQV